MKNCCTCHYLCSESISNNEGYFIKTLPKEYRNEEKIKTINSIGIRPVRVLCYKEMWDSKDFEKIEDVYFQILAIDRNKCTFYTRFIQNMSLDTMEEKIKIKDNNKDKKITRTIAIVAIIISVISLIESFF